MKRWLSIAGNIDTVSRATSIIAKSAVILMLSIGVWNVIGRYVGVAIGYNLSSNRLIEAQWYLFDCIFLLGLGWTLQKNNHVRVDVLEGFWGKRTKIKIELFGTLLLLLPFAIGILLLSISPTLESWRINELSPDPNGLPRYLIKTLIPIGFLLLVLQGFSKAIKEFSNLKKIRKLESKKHKEENKRA
tara:strand:+ start:2101 stop:2664 length:564 start_codon:yes stop_codon:yes gene_type:complete